MKLNITPNDFEYLKVIGKGYFGKVMKVKYKGDQQIYALKTIKKSKLKQQKHVEHIRCERKILESIDHPFIISLKFAFQTSTKLYIVMEFCNGGELFYHIRKKGRFSVKEAQFYFSQIVLAIEYLHKKKIIYRYRINKIEI
jgi:serine/threonine protein kinase